MSNVCCSSLYELVSGCWSNWELRGVQCSPCCDSDATRSPGGVIWVSLKPLTFSERFYLDIVLTMGCFVCYSLTIVFIHQTQSHKVAADDSHKK